MPLDPVFQTIASWPWSKVQATLKAYADGEFDFCLDADTIADITCLSDADTKRLVALLSENKSGLVNALTLLVSIVLIGESSQTSVDIRLEALFDLIDFSCVSSITIEETTILLIIISTAMSSIVNEKGKAPSDKVLSRASGVIYEALDKVSSLPLLKSEFILWATSILDELPTNKLDTIFTSVFLKGVGITGNSATKKQGAVEEEPDLPAFRKEEQENAEFAGDAEVPALVATGNLLVKSVSLSKIKGNDVYVTLRLGDGSVWAQSTDIAKNAGAEATEWAFESEEMSGEVEAAALHLNMINFTVKDSSESSADKYVGKAMISMEDLLDENNTNKLITLTGELRAHDDNEAAGEYTIKLKFLVPIEIRQEEATEEVVSDMLEEAGGQNESKEEDEV